jgi:hypothetical protein
MATIKALGDTIKIDKTFVSGKDRIAVNGAVVFEGKANMPDPARITVGNREYVVGLEMVSKFAKINLVHLQIYENGNPVHTGVYDQAGKPVTNPGQAKSSAGVQFCGMIGAIVGVTVMLSLNHATHTVPGGAIGGAIGGGVGGAIGGAIGTLLFGQRKA